MKELNAQTNHVTNGELQSELNTVFFECPAQESQSKFSVINQMDEIYLDRPYIRRNRVLTGHWAKYV
jgi:hypothetical protein